MCETDLLEVDMFDGVVGKQLWPGEDLSQRIGLSKK